MFPTDTALVLAAFLLSRITKDSKNLGSVPEATCNMSQMSILPPIKNGQIKNTYL
jgi:hypothetical protein